jgi:glucokinase
MDPITIGLAFTAAQSAVSHIKQAIALGKDINGLIGEFGKFFQSADTVHSASTKAKIAHIGKSDAELGRMALEYAMHSNKLREDERALKDMIYWQLGKPQIWEEMLKERNRLVKARQDEERAQAEAKQKHKEKMAEIFMTLMYCIAGSVILFAVAMGGVQVYSIMEEQRIYNEKIAKNQALRLQRARAEEKRRKEETLDAVK